MLNIRSCIHVASEFIAPEHISHCVRITEEIRQLPATHHRHTDVLNVRSLLVSRRGPQTPTARRQTRRLFAVLPCCYPLLLCPRALAPAFAHRLVLSPCRLSPTHHTDARPQFYTGCACLLALEEGKRKKDKAAGRSGEVTQPATAGAPAQQPPAATD